MRDREVLSSLGMQGCSSFLCGSVYVIEDLTSWGAIGITAFHTRKAEVLLAPASDSRVLRPQECKFHGLGFRV